MSSVQCPVCSKLIHNGFINSHLDSHFTEPAPSTSSPCSPQVDNATQHKRKSTPPLPSLAEASSSSQKRFKFTSALEAAKPLAERVRPHTLNDLIGQEHVLGKGTLLRNLMDQDSHGSLVLWGPPGTGKTTLARVLAKTTKSSFKEISATGGSAVEVKKLLEEAVNLLKLTGKRTLLFIDEIQRFNKAQQDVFLPYVEAGTVTVLLATTENPSFRLNSALLSRCRVVVLQKHSTEDCAAIIKRALHIENKGDCLSQDVVDWIARAADGDARVALSSAELALTALNGEDSLSDDEVKVALRKAHMQYDRNGDNHYDCISALHKSVRGGNADASLYWLARMLDDIIAEGGEDPLYVARRIIRMASEDIGLANPHALPQAVAAYHATQLIGMPECDVILAQVVVMLAESHKSVRVYKAMKRAKSIIQGHPAYPVPVHIRNAPTKLMKELGYGREYKYEPGYSHPVYQPFLPPELDGIKLLAEGDEPNLESNEEALKEWEVKVNGGQKWDGRM